MLIPSVFMVIDFSSRTNVWRVLEGVRPVVVSAIFVAGISLLQLALSSFTTPDLFAVGVFLVAFLALNNKKIPLGPITLLILGALAGIGRYLIVS